MNYNLITRRTCAIILAAPLLLVFLICWGLDYFLWNWFFVPSHPEDAHEVITCKESRESNWERYTGILNFLWRSY